MIEREEAYKLLKQYVSQDNTIHHMLSVESIMRYLSVKLGEDEELWGVTGLLHDLDLEIVSDNLDRHAYATVEILGESLPMEAKQAIIVHALHEEPQTRFDWALYCADPVSGLITAGVLTHPSKDIKQFTLKSLKKRFKDKRFAMGANREQIASCVNLGIGLDEFLELSLNAMQQVEFSNK